MNVTSEYFSAKKDNVNKQFNHFTGADENCQAFNNKNMWDLDQANSFSGFKKESNGSGFNNTCGNSFSGNKTIDQTLNAAGMSGGEGTAAAVAARWWKRRRGASSAGGTAAMEAGGTNCQDGSDCGVGETCRGGECVPLRGERVGGANKRMASNPTSNSTSRRMSSDRISNKPVMGTAIKSSFSAAEKVFPYGTGNNFGGNASARCGLDR